MTSVFDAAVAALSSPTESQVVAALLAAIKQQLAAKETKGSQFHAAALDVVRAMTTVASRASIDVHLCCIQV